MLCAGFLINVIYEYREREFECRCEKWRFRLILLKILFWFFPLFFFSNPLEIQKFKKFRLSGKRGSREKRGDIDQTEGTTVPSIHNGKRTPITEEETLALLSVSLSSTLVQRSSTHRLSLSIVPSTASKRKNNEENLSDVDSMLDTNDKTSPFFF